MQVVEGFRNVSLFHSADVQLSSAQLTVSARRAVAHLHYISGTVREIFNDISHLIVSSHIHITLHNHTKNIGIVCE